MNWKMFGRILDFVFVLYAYQKIDLNLENILSSRDMMKYILV